MTSPPGRGDDAKLNHKPESIHDDAGLLDPPLKEAIDHHPTTLTGRPVAGTPRNGPRWVPVHSNRVSTRSPSVSCSSIAELFGKRIEDIFEPPQTDGQPTN